MAQVRVDGVLAQLQLPGNLRGRPVLADEPQHHAGHVLRVGVHRQGHHLPLRGLSKNLPRRLKAIIGMARLPEETS